MIKAQYKQNEPHNLKLILGLLIVLAFLGGLGIFTIRELPERIGTLQKIAVRGSATGGKRAVCVWHRRSGKDLTAINFIATEALLGRVGTYYHLLPTYNQARKVVWDGMDNDGRRFIDYFHPDSLDTVNGSDIQIRLKSGSVYQLVGADTYDRLVGPNPVGLVLSEYSVSNLYPHAWSYLRPILAANNGWAAFLFTPRGRNHGFDLYHMAQENPLWFSEVLTVNDTLAIDPEVIAEERRAGMADEMINQEFFCSWIRSRS